MMISPASPAAGLAGRSPAPVQVTRDDRVDVGAAVGQELVLVDRGGELGHDQLSFRVMRESHDGHWARH